MADEIFSIFFVFFILLYLLSHTVAHLGEASLIDTDLISDETSYQKDLKEAEYLTRHGGATDAFLAGQRDHFRTELQPLIDADPNVVTKNKFLARLMDWVDDAEDNSGSSLPDTSVRDMLVTFWLAAGEASNGHEALRVEYLIRQQFKALWTVKTKL